MIGEPLLLAILAVAAALLFILHRLLGNPTGPAPAKHEGQEGGGAEPSLMFSDSGCDVGAGCEGDGDGGGGD